MSKKVCPMCGGTAGVIWGNGWDWDLEACFEKGCEYEKELDTMTFFDQDGNIIEVEHKDDEEE